MLNVKGQRKERRCWLSRALETKQELWPSQQRTDGVKKVRRMSDRDGPRRVLSGTERLAGLTSRRREAHVMETSIVKRK